MSRFVTNFRIALCLEGEKIVEVCQKGDKLLEEEIAKVYKGKKIVKGWSNPSSAQLVAEEPHQTDHNM